MLEMNKRRTNGKPVNVLIRASNTKHHQQKGDKMISSSRGSWNVFSNPLVSPFTKEVLQKAAKLQKGFHRLEDSGKLKKWSHPRIETLRQSYDKFKSVLDRKVEDTKANERPVFTTLEKYPGSDVQREPAMQKDLCTLLHQMRKEENDKEEDE